MENVLHRPYLTPKQRTFQFDFVLQVEINVVFVNGLIMLPYLLQFRNQMAIWLILSFLIVNAVNG